MEIFIRANGIDTLLRREELSNLSGQATPFREQQIQISHEQMGCITDTQVTTGNFLIAHCRFQLAQSIQLVKEVETDVIQLYFALQGKSQVLTGSKPVGRTFLSGQHNICYLPPSQSVYTYDASDQPQDYSVVLIPKDVYFRLVPRGSSLHQSFENQITQQKAGYTNAENLPITPAMDWLIRDMRASQRTGSLKRLFLESRITELLMLQLEQMQGASSPPLPPKKADTRKLHEARELLDASYPNSPTIVELAKLVGLNEFALKRGFKAQFGTTILGYMTQRRMEDARRFLLEGTKTISEISYWVGYKNPAHFTVAFKQYFGTLPGAVRIKTGQVTL